MKCQVWSHDNDQESETKYINAQKIAGKLALDKLAHEIEELQKIL